MGQSSQERLDRLERGACPIHGLSMSQADRWYYPEGKKPYTVVACPRRACRVIARAHSFDGPWELPSEFELLLDDHYPDPEYLDPDIQPAERRASLRHLASSVYAKTGGRCYYCGEQQSLEEMTIDHFVPMSAGGSAELDNLYPACWSCNTSKGPRHIEDFRWTETMKEFESRTGVRFTRCQLAYLISTGVELDIRKHVFWFERGNA